MRTEQQINGKYGVEVYDFDIDTASEAQLNSLKGLIYENKIVVLKNQNMSPAQYLKLGLSLGEPEEYYQPMYHHPDEKQIFVSSNVLDEGKQKGVPRTGKFWHADYTFMRRPFAFTLIYPQVVPTENRGTYFIDMAEAYEQLPAHLKAAIKNTYAHHSVRRYFKVRPDDVYRPISEVLADIEKETPSVMHPTTFTHPITGETVLYINEGFTYALEDAEGNTLDESILQELFEYTAQLDMRFNSPLVHLQAFSKGDLLLWDNRRLIHRALHAVKSEPSESYRLTLHDDYPFYEGITETSNLSA